MYVKPLVFTWPCAMLLRGSIGALWRRTVHGAGIKLRRDTLGLCGFTAHRGSPTIEAAKGRTCGSPFAQYNEARATGPIPKGPRAGEERHMDVRVSQYNNSS